MALTSDAWKGLKKLYPNVNHRLDYRLEAEADAVPVLVWWNETLGPKPTDEAITAAIADWEVDEAMRQTARNTSREERTQITTFDASLADYLALTAPTAAQTRDVVRLLVRAIRWQLRHLPEAE